MPVDYKLKSLRRVFGEASFLKRLDSGTASSKSRQSRTPSSTSGSAFGSDWAGSGTGAPKEGSDQAAKEEEAPTTRRKAKPQGGVPRAFYSGQPPRAIRNKAVASQLYTVHLYEKQKMKIYYGAMRDDQFRHYVKRAKAKRFNTDAELLRLLEMRLDTVLYRTGFVKSPMQARQWIFHRQVELNGRKVDVKSCELTPGDVISVRDDFIQRAYETQAEAAELRKQFGIGASWIVGRSDAAGMLPWMEIDRIGLSAALVRAPTHEELRSLKRAVLIPFIRDANLNPHAAMRAYR